MTTTNPTMRLNTMTNPLMFNNNSLNFGFNNNNIPLNQNPNINNLMPNTNFNLLENSFLPVSPSIQTVSNGPEMKQIFKNDQITVYVSLNYTPDKTQVNGAFYVSNNVNKILNNVKLNLSVKKHIICKVLSTSATSLEPLKSLGIKKVKSCLIIPK
jgi:hypothetical protein